MPGEMVPLGIWFSCEHSGNMARAARIMVRIGPGRLEGFVLVDAVNSQDIPVSRSTVFSRKMRWRPKENTFPWVSILFLGTPYILRKSNRRILKRSKSNRRILKRSKCRWHKLRKKEIRLLREGLSGNVVRCLGA